MTITREQAAERRAEQMPAPASRPMQRRLGEDALSRAGAVLVALEPQEVREVTRNGLTVVRVGGYASVTESGYEIWDMFGPYVEVVSQGAFGKTLSAAPLVEFTLNHGAGGGLPMAHTRNQTLDLAEDDTGLRYQATDADGNHFGVFWPADGGPAEVDPSVALEWNWDSHYWFNGANPDVARVWAIVYAPCGGVELAGEDGQFGDEQSVFGEFEAGTGDKYTIGTTATVGYVEAARATCSAFKAAGVVVSHIIVTRSPVAFNPTSPSGGPRPDGWWKHHGKIVDDGAGGYERVRARSDQGRYWIGTV